MAADKTLIGNMLATRVLVASSDAVNRNVQAGFDVTAPLSFELNRLLLPRHGRFPRKGVTIRLERPHFDVSYRKALKHAKPHLAPRSSHDQRELFRQDFSVFVSMPFDPSKRNRTSVLRRSIDRLYLEKTGHAGAHGRSYVDIHFIPQVGTFRDEIPSYIRDASYVVADISDVGVAPDKVPGVFYEVGIAVGERKPLALFYSSRGQAAAPAFAVEALPAVLRGQTVLRWEDRSENFHDQYRRIHEKLIAFNGFVTDAPSERHRGNPYAYVSVQPRNTEAQVWFTNLIRRLYPDLHVQVAKSWQPDDLQQLATLMANAAICIIDCTEHISSQALELGIAATTGRRRVVEVWNSELDRSVNPVAMFPGQKWAWTDLGPEDEKYVSRLLQDIGRATLLGTRRP
jgi:hypothetical protein